MISRRKTSSDPGGDFEVANPMPDAHLPTCAKWTCFPAAWRYRTPPS